MQIFLSKYALKWQIIEKIYMQLFYNEEGIERNVKDTRANLKST
jgi:hypothetical protein